MKMLFNSSLNDVFERNLLKEAKDNGVREKERERVK